MAVTGSRLEVDNDGGLPQDLHGIGVSAAPAGAVHRGGTDLPATGEHQSPVPVPPENLVGLSDELPQLLAIHQRKDAPKGGIRGHHGAFRPQPPLGGVGAREQVDLMEALLPEGQASRDQPEELRNRDLGPLAGLEEFLGPARKMKLVVAET